LGLVTSVIHFKLITVLFITTGRIKFNLHPIKKKKKKKKKSEWERKKEKKKKTKKQKKKKK